MTTHALPTLRVPGMLHGIAGFASRHRRGLAGGLVVVAVLFAVATRVTGYRYEPLDAARLAADLPVAGGEATAKEERETRSLTAALARTAPGGTYVVVDRVNNRVSLHKGDDVLLTGPCSTGSGKTLIDATGNRQWQFETPRGRFKVLNKTRDPIWKKPDWAFVEEGEEVPRNPGDRLEYGVLGEYGLYFGNGYLIHGTLYERLLGRSVSHGCIRVGKDNLKRIYEACPIGTSIYVH